tara:strand:- start:329 stop:505 length:177 start_codon:yes stop_codon:yes gene_type:complete
MIQKQMNEPNPQPGSFVLSSGKWWMVKTIQNGLIYVNGLDVPIEYEDIEMDDSEVGIA